MDESIINMVKEKYGCIIGERSAEMIKMAIDRILGEIDEVDEEMGVFAQKNTSVSFRLAFNTLIKYGIIIEENEDNE
jgi:actin-like ATPase involved in cell morphogenesis